MLNNRYLLFVQELLRESDVCLVLRLRSVGRPAELEHNQPGLHALLPPERPHLHPNRGPHPSSPLPGRY